MARAPSSISVLETPVLIIGSSMVGMTLSALLAQKGISDCLTIEKHSSTAIHPRAALFHPRTMQIYRELGLYDAMKTESYKHYDKHAGLHAVETLAGKSLGTWMKDINEGLEEISPTSRLFLTQQMFEPLLREHAVRHGARLRFSTELVDFTQDAEGVTAVIRDTESGAEQRVRARYMVACDGNRSFVRGKLGIPMQGHGLLSHSLTIYFRADLSRFVEGKYNGVIYVNNPEVRGFFRLDKTGREGFLAVNTAGGRGSEASRFPGKDITNERAREILQAAIGAEVDFEITLLSPGGFGGNTGIQDAHNIAWKIALVLQDQAHPDLINTYEMERWPVAKKTIDQVFVRYIVRTAPELKTEDLEMEDEVPEPCLELGYQYRSHALMSTGLPNGSVMSNPATAKAAPGTMAHHVLLSTMNSKSSSGVDREASNPVPIADLLGHGFVLLCGEKAKLWIRAGRTLNGESGTGKSGQSLPKVQVHQVMPAEANNHFYEKYQITPHGCVLIRPDGFVAWAEKGQEAGDEDGAPMDDAVARLQGLMRTILCRSPRGLESADSDNAAIKLGKL
ncbi:hypothetical protein B0A54_15950 [Friedmanniomyces endolithicus]|uniref:FAD-binding domain-containing protein n=1 Tax=Friedmanniomyces endolithicus TaxID=329885 RepID=A0A4U0U1F1_9PEZI|nr:hypothetical protein B0A54_15950 [Friedmanniomyces endolithicus]